MAHIEFENVSKGFSIHTSSTTLKGSVVDWLKGRRFETKRHSVLHDCTFSVSQGESLAIIGPNGAGKSTILKLVASIYRPDSGHVRVDGTVAALLEVGAGFQADLTGRENVYLYGSILGMSRRTMQDSFQDIINFSEIGQYIDMPVRTYSSGMYMRLAFSVAIHVSPDVLVIDEVLAVGDERFQTKCLARIKDMQQGGVTVLFVSHDLGAVQSISDRVLLLRRDASFVIGSPEEMVRMYLLESHDAS